MEREYDHIKEYIKGSLDEELRLLISDFAILWNNYEHALFNEYYQPSRIKENVLKNINLNNSDTFTEQLYERLKEYYNYRGYSFTVESIKNNFNIRHNDINDLELERIFNSNNSIDKLHFLLLIVGRIRNNMFHGIKLISDLSNQKDLFKISNEVLTYTLANTNKLDKFANINNFSKKQYLDFKDDNNNIYIDLIYAVNKLSKIDNFDVYKFYDCLNKIIENVYDSKTLQLIKIYPINKPKYLFGTIYYLLKDSVYDQDLIDEFDYLSKFIDYEVDIFTIVNYLRNN